MFPAFQLWQELKMLPDTGRTVDQKEIAIKEIYWQSLFQRLKCNFFLSYPISLYPIMKERLRKTVVELLQTIKECL